ncbi:Disease resistance protein RPS2 [Abeliophyllum distichum]|uniref:Disease resistance protein RPS2 n=1 Tax=Abeliophyllum distichum TaxID=126358 RepID=A0ABD1VC89_9LAMI
MFTRKFQVKVLSKDEAWQLFRDAAGISDDATDVKAIAEQVAEECGGLPLALGTVGKALKNGKEHAWRNALQQLQNSRVTNIKGMHNLVYSQIEFSYNYLESNEAKSLLLLCSLFPEDQIIPIECLVRYARGLELFKNTDTLSETRDMVYSIADDLKSCYLLLSGDEEGVKMHDVVRDVCLSIASKDKHEYMVKHSGLKEWPKGYTYKSYTAISLTFDFPQPLPSGLKCPNLKLLRVVLSEPYWVDISQEFFENMQELKVLDFNSMSIEITSFKSLTSLQTLCLDYCTLNNDLSTIGRLKKLEILSFYHSSLYDFPSEISELSNLKSLDLRFEQVPCPLPPGFLIGLKKLEELYLGYLDIGDDKLKRNYIAAISSLAGLNTFQICTDNSKFMLQILRKLRLEKLQRFQIVRGYEENVGNFHFKRSLHLFDIDTSMLSEPAIISLMRRTDDLLLEVKAWKNPVNELDEDGFINLKKLTLQSCGFEYLIDATDFTPAGAFSSLQELYLQELSKMKNLWTGLIKSPSLYNLRILKMHQCPAIRNLFPESVAKCLVNLKIAEISRCIKLEEIVSRDTVENEITEMLEFPVLNHLNLQSLKSFKCFRSESTTVSTVNNIAVLETLFNQVALPNMEVLEVVHLNCLVKMLDSIKLLQNLRSLKIVKCAAVKVLFDFEGLTVEDRAEGILGKLNSLNLIDLPKLEYILRKVPKGIQVFRDLRWIRVIVCGSLRYLFSPSVANLIVGLEILTVDNCSALEEIIGREEETSETAE